MKYLIIIIAVIFLTPLIFMASTSISPEKSEVSLLAKTPTLENYYNLFQLDKFGRWNFNSIAVATITATLMCIFSTMSGYVLSKLKVPGGKWIFLVMVGTMAIPKQAILVPLFQLMNQLNWTNTYIGLIVPALAYPFGIFLMRQFIQTIPREVIEAARIDGCGEFRILWNIITPLAKPAITALFIFTFVRSYNDYFWQLIMIRTSDMQTLPLAIANLQQLYDQRLQLIMAGAVVASVPMLTVFMVFNGYFIKGINLGGVNK